MKRLIVVSAMLLTGCASMYLPQSHYNETVSKWVGKPIIDLVQKVGIPNKTMDLPDGSKAYEYYRTAGSTGTAEITSRTTASLDSVKWWCRTTYYTDKDGIIRHYSWKGNACR